MQKAGLFPSKIFTVSISTINFINAVFPRWKALIKDLLRVSRTKPLQKFLVAVVWGCELRRFEKMKNLVLVFLVPLISCQALLFGRDGKTFFYNISRARIYQILCGPCFEIHVLSIQQFQLISCRSTSFSLSFQINLFHVRKYQVYYMFLSFIPVTRFSNVRVQKSRFYILLSFPLLFISCTLFSLLLLTDFALKYTHLIRWLNVWHGRIFCELRGIILYYYVIIIKSWPKKYVVHKNFVF